MLNPHLDPTIVETNKDPILSTRLLRSMWRHYTRSEADWDNFLVAPSKAKSLSGLPPAIIVTGGTDPLRHEGRDFASALRRDGVSVLHRHYEGLFTAFGLPHPLAQVAMQDVVDAVVDAFK